ncbi:MAG: diphthine--ammonia ligase [Candidatus Nanoarchaeia archaeon]
MKLAVLFSGGKDSHLAMYKASQDHDIVCAITMRSENQYSYMFQSLGVEYTTLQLECQNVAQILIQTQGEKERELEDLKKGIEQAVREYEIEGIVTGAIQSTYQAIRVQNISYELNLWCFNPLWNMSSQQMFEELNNAGFEITILGVFAYPLTQTLVMQPLLSPCVMRQLFRYEEQYQISAIGEGGEIETFVTNGPMYVNATLHLSYQEIIEESEHCAYVSGLVCKLIR